jgi:hypothetical protein
MSAISWQEQVTFRLDDDDFLIFFYRQHIHHITCTEQDKHIISVNDSYCYLSAQHI